GDNLTFELIQHRFTKSAKRVILERFPHTSLDLNEENRMYKWGKYGRGKYVYPKEAAQKLEQYMNAEIMRRFPQAKVEYFT
ncbi:MAG TPA: spore photoproduct lyase, partial [Firmicutes bacterium]|nr:spore photoproduct lyase [Bacillota bacterium]